jgi:sortase A
MPSRRTSFVRWIEWLLWIAAVAALGYSAFVVAEGRIYQFYLNQKFSNALESQGEGTLTPAGHPWQGAQAIHGSAENPLRSSALWPYIGRVEIPRLDMSIMLLDGIDNRTLRRGIGHIPGTALPGESGNAGIAGHRDTFFRGLGEIRKYDRITVRTFDGEYQYVVDSVRVVGPDAVEVLNDVGHPVLTLVTCYPFHFIGPAPKRFVVQAFLKER